MPVAESTPGFHLLSLWVFDEVIKVRRSLSLYSHLWKGKSGLPSYNCIGLAPVSLTVRLTSAG